LARLNTEMLGALQTFPSMLMAGVDVAGAAAEFEIIDVLPLRWFLLD